MFVIKWSTFSAKTDWLPQMSKFKISRNRAITYTKKGWRSFIKRFCITAFFVWVLSLNYVTQLSAATDNSLLGIFDASNGWQMAQVQALESWQGKKHAVVNMFTTWCDQPSLLDNLFNQQLLNIWNNQNVPMVSWEPFFCVSNPNATDAEVRAGTPGDIEVRAANGEFNAYLNNWADRMKTFLSGPDGAYHTSDDRRAYIRFAHEMNGDWYPWGATNGGNTPADYVRMWQHVKSIFHNQGMEWTHLQWVWTANADDIGQYRAESFYPGDNYVDWVSMTGYNWGATQTWSNWRTMEQAFGPMLSRLRALTTKPVCITEFASTTLTTSGPNVADKSWWITDAYNYALAQDIKMLVWFNVAKETDWAVFGGPSGDSTFNYNGTTYNAYSAYRSAVGANSFVSSDTTNPRLLTDAKFSGY